MRTLTIPARFDQLERVRQFVVQAAYEAGLNEKAVAAVEMAVDEACSNIIEHAYRGIAGGQIECTCDINERSLTVVLRDYGHPFDIANVPPPDLTNDLKRRRVGGLGVFLMRKLMDEVKYQNLGKDGNLLTMVKYLREET
ncbi:MAG: ATP-binding protein [Anaerolineales bacterium]|nr:ATP-binding protein [Anaerolineales bacterium]MCX7608997.1 ATP-binding protein [Anaerolineales bacterium]